MTPGSPKAGKNGKMPVNEDCRHYVRRLAKDDEVTERCKLGANDPLPFSCPEGCLFYEPRGINTAGWQV
jgi:hypothetical protein